MKISAYKILKYLSNILENIDADRRTEVRGRESFHQFRKGELQQLSNLHLDTYRWHVQQNDSKIRICWELSVSYMQMCNWHNCHIRTTVIHWICFKMSVSLPARWKTTRSQLTPAFTQGKIKPYFPLIAEVCEELKTCIENSCKL
jgi:hypothetical protein